MGANAIGTDHVNRTEPSGVSGARAIETGHAVKGKNYLYKTVNALFSK